MSGFIDLTDDPDQLQEWDAISFMRNGGALGPTDPWIHIEWIHIEPPGGRTPFGGVGSDHRVRRTGADQ